MNQHLIEPMLRPLSRCVRGLAEHSQRQACRNAMVASTALAARRQEREDVQLFVEDLLARRGPVAEVVPDPPAAAQLG
jgi:hypothetical protein